MGLYEYMRDLQKGANPIFGTTDDHNVGRAKATINFNSYSGEKRIIDASDLTGERIGSLSFSTEPPTARVTIDGDRDLYIELAGDEIYRGVCFERPTDSKIAGLPDRIKQPVLRGLESNIWPFFRTIYFGGFEWFSGKKFDPNQSTMRGDILLEGDEDPGRGVRIRFKERTERGRLVRVFNYIPPGDYLGEG